MSALMIYPDNQSQHGELLTDFESIQHKLNVLGVNFERWTANREWSANATEEEILEGYSEAITALRETYGFQSVDVVTLTPDHPEKDTIRKRFLAEHTHDDFEIRFFVDGRGLFYLHVERTVYLVLCERGDLISVPANTTHWFDMGEQPYFKAIRLFTTPYGWVANFTGSDIATLFPTLDQFVENLP